MDDWPLMWRVVATVVVLTILSVLEWYRTTVLGFSIILGVL